LKKAIADISIAKCCFAGKAFAEESIIGSLINLKGGVAEIPEVFKVKA